MNDLTLLRRYVDDRSEDAFRRLFEKHHTLVYSACLRDIGDRGLAEDATIAVFVILAQKARHLRRHRSLAGWLYITARLTARDIVKKEIRRRHREQPLEADQPVVDDRLWSRIELALHDAIDDLPAPDREAILLRFYEGLSVKELAAQLSISEEAAKKRVARSLERLRRGLAGATGAIGIAALVALLDEHAHASASGLPTSITHDIVADSLTDRLREIANRGIQRMQRTQLTYAAAVVSGVILLAGGIGGVIAHTRQAVDQGSALAALDSVREHYQSAGSYSTRIVNDFSSGLFPGYYAQELAWKSPATFTLKLTSPRSTTRKPGAIAGTGDPDDFYGSGETIHEVGPSFPSTGPRVRFNSMPGWEVSGGFVISWLERTPTGGMFDHMPADFPPGTRIDLTWGNRSTWHNHAVREIVGTLVMPSAPKPAAADIASPPASSPKTNSGGHTLSLFIDPANKTLIGIETPINGHIGYTEYVGQQFDATVTANVGVAP